MLKTVLNSGADKTQGLAVTYRSGGYNQFGTCPTTCSLNPLKDNKIEKLDTEYLETIVNTIPKKGISFTYTHFNLDKLENLKLIEDIKYNKKKATINRSADTIEQALEYYNNDYDTVVVLPYTEKPDKHFTKDGVKFVRCIAEYNKKINCSNCNLCADKQRKFVVVFYAHGSKKKKIGLEKGGCYGANGRTNIHWIATQKQEQIESDTKKLKSFIKSLPHGKKLRHHIVGDIGLDK
jgi:hypothetical protein|tara:strand:+ start:171 stop:878 length:708 start_codon:yes stop_codon:yes gene_type:complete